MFYEYVIGRSLAELPLMLDAVISYSDHKHKNKAAITEVYDEACLWRIHPIVFASAKSARNKDSTVVFVHTVHIPIKMQMSAVSSQASVNK